MLKTGDLVRITAEIGDVVRVKTGLCYTHEGKIGFIDRTIGDNYYSVLFEHGSRIYASEALEVLC